MESHLRERTDEHSQCCVNANEDDVATDRTNVLNYVESDCIAEESSDDELYYVISDYKAAEDNQVHKNVLDTPFMSCRLPYFIKISVFFILCLVCVLGDHP